MHPQTLLAHFCSLLFGLSSLTNATPFFVTPAIPTVNDRDLISLLVGGNILPDGGATSPSSLGSPHTQTVSSIETSRLQSSIEPSVVPTPIHSLISPTLASSTTKSSIGIAFLVQTSPVFLPEVPSNPSPSSNPTPTGGLGDVSATPPAELTEWKVIGIGVITVTLIGILILSISFFDSWWGFLRSVICGTKVGAEGEETMVPDGETLGKSWELKLDDEDGHRYPTLSSMESIQKKDECKGPVPWNSNSFYS